MKKVVLFFASLCLTARAFSTSPGGVFVERESGQPGNIHFRTSVDESGEVMKISAAELNICDDSIARAISYPSPLSVSEALSSIRAELLLPSAAGKMIEIDLSGNTICDEGANAIGEFFGGIDDSIKIKSLDLSWNRITDSGILTLVTSLRPLLSRHGFGFLRIVGNYGANTANIRKLLSGFGQDKQEVIGSKIQM